MKNVLVTGSSGFVARHLIPALKSRECTIQGLDLRPQPGAIESFYTHFDGDVRNAEEVVGASRGMDTVIHLAAEHKDFGIAAADYQSVNVDGMRVLLESADRCGIRNVVFYSSVAVYGDAPDGSREVLVPNPVSEYGKSKLAAERLLVEWSERSSSRTALIFRPTVIYGEHNVANMYRLIDAIWRKRYLQLGQGANKKSIVYIGNAVAATLHVMDRSRANERVFNLSDSPAWTSRAIAESIAEHLGRTIPRLRIPAEAGTWLVRPADWVAKATGVDIPITAARIQKYLSDSVHYQDELLKTGFVPPHSQDEGISRTVAWYKKELDV